MTQIIFAKSLLAAVQKHYEWRFLSKFCSMQYAEVLILTHIFMLLNFDIRSTPYARNSHILTFRCFSTWNPIYAQLIPKWFHNLFLFFSGCYCSILLQYKRNMVEEVLTILVLSWGLSGWWWAWPINNTASSNSRGKLHCCRKLCVWGTGSSWCDFWPA